MSQNLQRDVLPFVPATATPQASPLSLDLTVYLEQLATLEPTLLAELAKQDEAVILDTRSQARQLTTHGWRLECACDAAIWEQTEQAKRGRGNRDVDSVGILAAVSKKSKLIGVTPRTIYNNKEVFHLMQAARNVASEHNILEVLTDKGYYQVALTAADPVKALALFAERKVTQKRFRVSDANRLLKAEGQTRQAVRLQAVEQIRKDTGQLTARQTLLAHIETARTLIKEQVIPFCPDEEFNERIWNDLLLTLGEEQQGIFDADAQEALVKAWDGGAHREDEMAQITGLPLPDVSRLMELLDEKFIRIVPRAMNERSQFTLWHKSGEPFDNARYMPYGKR